MTRDFYLNETDSVKVEFMALRKNFRFGEFKEFNSCVLELEYENSDASFLIVLPESRTGLAAVEAKLNDIDFHDVSSKLHKSDVRLHLPKFRIELLVDLNDTLKKLGVQRAFKINAEFDEILESITLQLSKAVHKCFVEVNEKGTEASAATWKSFDRKSGPTYFFADHPFLFVLKTKSQVAFIGRCCEPKM
jgi:serpin B